MNKYKISKFALISLAALGLTFNSGCQKIKNSFKSDEEIAQETKELAELKEKIELEKERKQWDEKKSTTNTDSNNESLIKAGANERSIDWIKRDVQTLDNKIDSTNEKFNRLEEKIDKLTYLVTGSTNNTKINNQSYHDDRLRLDEPITINAKIEDIQPSHFRYWNKDRNRGYDCPHPIIWIFAKNTETGEKLKLIYPNTGGFHKGYIKLTYNPVNGGSFQQLDFLQKYSTRQANSQRAKHVIHADGIIQIGKIEYIQKETKSDSNKNELKNEKIEVDPNETTTITRLNGTIEPSQKPKEEVNKLGGEKEKIVEEKIGLVRSEPQSIDGTIIELYHSGVMSLNMLQDRAYCNSVPVIWVTIQGRDEVKTLLYPYNEGLHKGVANITYQEVKDGKFDQGIFLNEYFEAKSSREKMKHLGEPIFAEGIITEDGVNYDL
ncbi:hypothetical protein HOK51_04165 [Candidatus Woesearchaeota archaeon]|jgi:hypothetical protein|nr:hypothetical protein [Candidatus Woesearchaeota archaeon]MBT6519017.1 hypothetical protein [Candidatus Woesearchaeota archaeon]MBT7368784.1 hypothetical protein [Candidatus Woesearchaeota archaeon]